MADDQERPPRCGVTTPEVITGDRLIDEALRFAHTLGEVINGTVATGVGFDVAPYEVAGRVWIYPHGSRPGDIVMVPLDVGLDDPATCRLFLKLSFFVSLDDTGEHLMVHQSAIHLMVDPRLGAKRPRPVIRLEYDRDRGSEPDDLGGGSHRRSAAHIQVHGTSAEIAAVQTIRGVPLTGIEALHIPVGGRRFRPTIEDFIEFLAVHNLVGVEDGWRAVLAVHRGGWLRNQLKAAVRNDPDAAIEQLVHMGYKVSQG